MLSFGQAAFGGQELNGSCQAEKAESLSPTLISPSLMEDRPTCLFTSSGEARDREF